MCTFSMYYMNDQQSATPSFTLILFHSYFSYYLTSNVIPCNMCVCLFCACVFVDIFFLLVFLVLHTTFFSKRPILIGFQIKGRKEIKEYYILIVVFLVHDIIIIKIIIIKPTFHFVKKCTCTAPLSCFISCLYFVGFPFSSS